jgi:hypothetical protein
MMDLYPITHIFPKNMYPEEKVFLKESQNLKPGNIKHFLEEGE